MQAIVAAIETALREVERRAEELPAGSPEQRAARKAAERLARVYQEVSAGIVSEASARVVFRELDEAL
jgi:hypothetical protein